MDVFFFFFILSSGAWVEVTERVRAVGRSSPRIESGHWLLVVFCSVVWTDAMHQPASIMLVSLNIDDKHYIF